MREKIVLVGGGSSAHVMIPFISSPRARTVEILTSKPQLWKRDIITEWQDSCGTVVEKFSGRLDNASSSTAETIPDADIIIFCMPVHCYNQALENIGPYINKEKDVLIGTVYGQGGFNWMVNRIKGRYGLAKLKTFAIGLLPWISRTRKYGHVGITYGPKAINIVAFDDEAEFKKNSELLDDLCFRHFGRGKFRLAKNFLSLTLSVDNQIIHPSRLYGLYKVYGGRWQRKEDVPYFYRDYDDLSAELLKNLDNDYTRIRKYIVDNNKGTDFEYMLNYLDLERLTYQSCNENIKDSFTKSPTLGAIVTPVVKNGTWYEFDRNHRFFHDDIYYGLVIAKWIAQKANISVAYIDEILVWAEDVLGESILDHGLLDRHNRAICTPEFYGLNSLDDIIS